MADDPNLEPGKSINIATRGLSYPAAPITVATDGFIIPIIGDIIISGEAGVVFTPGAGTIFDYIGSGGLIIDGEAQAARSFLYDGTGPIIIDGVAGVARGFTYVGSGGLIINGDAIIDTLVEPTVGGQLTLGGMATVSRGFAYNGTGNLVIDGDSIGKLVFNPFIDGGIACGGGANVNFSIGVNGEGGLVVGGMADYDTTGQAGFGRGGATSARRVPKLPNTEFEFPTYDRDDYLEPMDYLKKIQDFIDKAEQDKQEMFKYLSKGTVKINGRGKVVAIYRDQPDSEMIVADNPPLEPIELDLQSIFNKGTTAIEIAELEDHLLLNDLFGLGDYKINKGVKNRFVHKNKTSTGGSANVSFISGANKVKHVNIKHRRQQQEDDELLLGIEKRRMMSRQERDEEELRLLGLID